MYWYIYGEHLGTTLRVRMGPFPSYSWGVVYLRRVNADLRVRSGMTRLAAGAYVYTSARTRERMESWYLFTPEGARHIPAIAPPEQLEFPELKERPPAPLNHAQLAL